MMVRLQTDWNLVAPGGTILKGLKGIQDLKEDNMYTNLCAEFVETVCRLWSASLCLGWVPTEIESNLH